jgi:hypothetical protein
MITTETLLDLTEYGTPSGNYDGSSQDWASVAVKAANYYRGRGGLQTVVFSVSNFEGIITVEATLDSNADSATWFETFVFGDGTPVTSYFSTSILGNFTWMRVRVEGFDGGTINSVVLTY